MRLVKDLGMEYASLKSKTKTRFGLYICPDCEKAFRTATSSVKSGNTTRCRECSRKVVRKKNLKYGDERASVAFYSIVQGRKKKGVVNSIFKNQRHNSKFREHPAPTYTNKELKQWLYSQPLFHKLYDEWVDSGYLKEKKPSVDRIDDNISYKMSNIQLMTWGDNKSKFNSDRISGVNRSQSRQVYQYDMDGSLIGIFHSMMDAQRSTGVSAGYICEVCNGNKDSANGYKWGATKRGKYLTMDLLKDLLMDEKNQNLTVEGFIEMLITQGLIPPKKEEMLSVTDPLGIDKLPKDDSTFSDSYMEVGK